MTIWTVKTYGDTHKHMETRGYRIKESLLEDIRYLYDSDKLASSVIGELIYNESLERIHYRFQEGDCIRFVDMHLHKITVE